MRLGLIAAGLALMGCKDAPKPPSQPPSREQCVDRWLKDRGLNPYGDAPDTNYPGGTPLFDERTGKVEDRVGHVIDKHPEAGKSCP